MADSEDNRRAIARRERREAGDESARLACTIMKMPAATAGKLKFEDELKKAVIRARAVTSPSARRRAERTLAAELRRADLDDLAKHVAEVQAGIMEEPKHLRLAEDWRTRMIEGGEGVVAEFPRGATAELMRLVHQARRERDSGKPPGAGKALFRHIATVLQAERARPAAPAAAVVATAEDADDDEDDADADADD